MRPTRPSVLLLVLVLAVIIATASAPAAAPEASPRLGYHASTLLVAFDDGVGAVARSVVHTALGAQVVNRFDEMNLDVVRLREGVDPALVASRYEANSLVRYASLNKVVRALAAPNDTLFSSQWGFHNTGQTVPGSIVSGKADFDIDAPEGWGIAFPSGFESTGGKRVAVLDTGADLGHADLLGKIKACASATSAIGVVVEGSCQDDGAHGTHTAGTVAANTNNTAGVAGTAPNAELAIFKFLNAGGVGFLADEIAGLRWAYQSAGAHVISMSFGAYEPDDGEQDALRDAAAAGLLLVAAAGNDFDETKNYPAYYPEVLSVAATSANDDIADFSNCNTDVEIAAPGEDVWSTLPGNSYGLLSGTSMATPHVAGAGALIMAERGLSASQARNTLVSTGVDVTGNDGRSACNGLRQINLAAALGGGGGGGGTGPGAIAGTVTDSKSKAGIGGATVNCGSAGTATTAANGSYSLTNVPAGNYSCTASANGYASKTQSVAVASGAASTANFGLRKLR